MSANIKKLRGFKLLFRHDYMLKKCMERKIKKRVSKLNYQ